MESGGQLRPAERGAVSLRLRRPRYGLLNIAESTIFTIFVVAYLYNLGKDLHGPTREKCCGFQS